jgi:glycosyltransferase involved in cell wall biosynthesis
MSQPHDTPAKKPLISVVMPAYRSEKTVLRAVNSILAQSHKDLELIVVHDAFPGDGTAALLAAVADPRLKVIDSPQCLGPGGARRLGVSHARGRYIAVQDADDFSYPERLAVQLEFMREHRLALCGTWGYMVHRDGTRSEFRQAVSHAVIKRSIMASNMFIHTTVMFEKAAYDAVGGYDPRRFKGRLCAEDYDLLLRLVQRYRAGNVPRILAEYTAPKDDPSYIWGDAKATACVRCNAVLKYGYPFYTLIFGLTPFATMLVPRRMKLLLKRRLLDDR